MKLRSFLPFVLTTLALCAPPAWSADYALKKSGLKTGDTLNVEANMTLDDAKMQMSFQGQNIMGTMNMSKRKVQVNKITATGAEGVSGVEATIKEDTEKQAITMNGQQQGGDKKEPLHGVTLVSTKAGGKWTSQLKDGQATAEQTKELAKLKYFESDEFYEDRPVAVGQSWTVPPERMAKALSDTMSGKVTGTMSCKFERIEAFDGRQCAVIAIEMKVTGEVPDQPGTTVTMDVKGTIFRALDLKYDAKVDLTGTMKMAGPLPNPPGAKLEAAGALKMTETMTLVK